MPKKRHSTFVRWVWCTQIFTCILLKITFSTLAPFLGASHNLDYLSGCYYTVCWWARLYVQMSGRFVSMFLYWMSGSLENPLGFSDYLFRFWTVCWSLQIVSIATYTVYFDFQIDCLACKVRLFALLYRDSCSAVRQSIWISGLSVWISRNLFSYLVVLIVHLAVYTVCLTLLTACFLAWTIRLTDILSCYAVYLDVYGVLLWLDNLWIHGYQDRLSS